MFQEIIRGGTKTLNEQSKCVLVPRGVSGREVSRELQPRMTDEAEGMYNSD